MNLNDLPVQDRELVLALIEIARTDCQELSWTELEPVLAACWNDTDRRTSQLGWRDIADHVRHACKQAETRRHPEPSLSLPGGTPEP